MASIQVYAPAADTTFTSAGQTSTSVPTSPVPVSVAAEIATGPPLRRIQLPVIIGNHGIGTVVQLSSDNRLIVGGFRAMPDGSANPSQKAGILVNDIIDQIQGTSVTTIDHIKKCLQGKKGSVMFTVLRKGK